MRIWIDVATALEGAELRRGLRNPTVRAFVRVMAAPVLRDECPGTLCGGRCFLEFLDALRRRETTGIHDDAERPGA